jgi:copper transport protein
VSSDVLHVLAAAAWAGGLGVLALTWEGSRERALRFSRLALVVAPLTIATGLLNAWLQERSVGAITDSDHGRLVLAKLVGALVMLAFGLVHRRWLADTARSVAGMVIGVRVEAAVGLAVVGLTAVLVATPPGRDVASEPVTQVRQAGDTTVRMQVDPARSGPNEVHLYYLQRDGSLASVDAAELEVSSGDIQPRRVALTPITASHATASGIQLTPGRWRFHLTVVSRGVPAETDFEVPIR